MTVSPFRTAAINSVKSALRSLAPPTARERISLAAMLFSGAGFLAIETVGLVAFLKLAGQILPELPGYRLEYFAGNLLPSFFGGLAVLLTFGSLTTAVSLLFLSDDILYLLPLPIPGRQIFGRQLGLSIAYSSSPALFLLLPVLVLIGTYSSHPWLAMTAFAAVLISMVLVCGLAGALLSLLLVRIIPPHRARLVAGTFSALSLGAALVGARQTRPERLFDPVAAVELLQSLASEPPGASHMNPLHLMAVSCTQALTGDSRGLHGALGGLLAAALLFIAAAHGLAGTHLSAFRRSREESGRRTGDRAVRRQGRSPSFTRELFSAELRNLGRDAGTPAQIGSLLAVLILNVLNLKLLPTSDAAGKDLVFGLQTGLTLFLVSALSLRFTFPSVSAEGRSALLLRTFPVDPAISLRIRLAVHATGAVLLTTGLTVLSALALKVSGPAFLRSFYFSIVGALAIPAIQLGFGALFPRFSAPNAIAAALGPGGFVAIGVSMLFALPTAVLASREVLSLLQSLLGWPLPGDVLSILWGIAALAAAWFAMRLGIDARRSADLSLP